MKNLSEENKNILVVRILIMCKMNEIMCYQNCKKSINDSHGKNLMEYMVETQKKDIMRLEEYAATLPDELKEEFTEVSNIILDQFKAEFSDLMELKTPATESSYDPSTDTFIGFVPKIDENGKESDMVYLEGCIHRKGYAVRMHKTLLDCLNNNEIQDCFHNIIEEEENHQQLMVHHLNTLQNTGQWPEEL
ncbi:MAG: hypothetical protein JSV49_01375 [Thermoplasmata archaeon]|nr:MAG: hypothetical protein JSV49_01375 [Thermoplasmata archaeon]